MGSSDFILSFIPSFSRSQEVGVGGSLYMGSSDFILSFIPSFSRSQEVGVALLLSVDRSQSQGVSKAAAGVSFLALMISAQTPALLVLSTVRY
jgi:hypothetical protein